MEGTTKNDKKKEDIISELSDDLLCKILSLLPTKEVIATSLLCKRWRFVWTMVPSIHIQCSNPIIKSHGSVTTFIALLRTENIASFHLKCNTTQCLCSSVYVKEWVSAVTTKKVKKVSISLFKCHKNVLNLTSLFTCTTILSLKIDGCFDLYIPSFSHLPNIKILDLCVNTSVSHTNIRKLISKSPTLELFHLKHKSFTWNLKELKIVRNSRVIQVSQYCFLYQLLIRSDSDYDFISDYAENCLNIVKAKAYVTVYGDKKHAYGNKIVVRVLKRVRNVEFLSLGDFRAEMDLSIIDLPHFKNLVELRLFLRNADSFFMELPGKCPKLKVVEVNIIDDRYAINQRFRYHVHGGVKEPDLSIVPYSSN